MLRKFSRRFAHLFWVAVFAAVPAVGQMTGIKGTVLDQQGKPVPGAIVVFERTDVAGHWQVKADKKGNYGHYGLPLGEFNITLFAPDAKTKLDAVNHVRTHLGDPQEINFDLKKNTEERQANPTAGMSKEQAAEFEKQQKEQQAALAKIGQLNTLLAQNKQLRDAGQFEQAAQVMEQAAAQLTASGQTVKGGDVVYANLADDYVGAKQYDKAVDAYQKAIAMKPTDAGYHLNLGNVYAKTNKTADAQAEFDKAAQMDPAQAKTAYFNEGAIFYNAGKMDEANQAFDKALQVDPQYADAWFYKGMSLFGKATLDQQTQKITPAPGTVEALQKYLQLAPTGKNADAAKGALQSLEGSIQTSFKQKKKK